MPLLNRPQSREARAGSSRRLPADNRTPPSSGGVRGINLLIIVLVVLAVGGAAVLLARTVMIAQRIDTKAQNIAVNGKGINDSTDSIVQLNRTNELATSILRSAKPLDGRLTAVVGRARSIRALAGSIDNKAGTINSTAGSINESATTINGNATSINGSASTINSSARTINGTAGTIAGSARDINQVAGRINGTAKSIDSTAEAIVGVAKLIDRDAANINQNLTTTIGIARSIKVDTGDILGQAGAALDTAGCIDNKLDGGGGDTADCKGRP